MILSKFRVVYIKTRHKHATVGSILGLFVFRNQIVTFKRSFAKFASLLVMFQICNRYAFAHIVTEAFMPIKTRSMEKRSVTASNGTNKRLVSGKWRASWWGSLLPSVSPALQRQRQGV